MTPNKPNTNPAPATAEGTNDIRITDVITACGDALLDVYLTVYDRVGLTCDLDLIRTVCTQQTTITKEMTDRAWAVTRQPRFWMVRAGARLHFGGRHWGEIYTVRWFLDLMEITARDAASSLATARQYAEHGNPDELAEQRTLVLNSLWQRYSQFITRRVR